MSVTRNSEQAITFHCDTPKCDRLINVASQRFETAAKQARRRNWAIGESIDACPDHHV